MTYATHHDLGDMTTTASPSRHGGAVRVRVPAPPGKAAREVVLHVGATNSGKTHESLQELIGLGRGIYVAPLRMLAQEVFERLSSTCGAEHVGLLTGDQIVRPEAPMLCCTAEMAPAEAPFAVIDEAHWLGDPSRGKSWTRLLIEGKYPRVSIIAAAETELFLKRLFPTAPVVTHKRLGELWDGGETQLGEIWPGTVVVAFSRAAVLALAREIRLATGLATGVLYGALPSAVRVQQVARFETGEIDVLVATDSIGHGVNLPTSTIVFAETEKFDGTGRRDLRTWEAAQIAGRAGRGERPGVVQTLVGVPGLNADTDLVATAVAVATGREASDLAVEAAPIGPTFEDLGVEIPGQLLDHLREWEDAARVELADHPWATATDVRAIKDRLSVLVGMWRDAWPLDAESTWLLVSAPVRDNGAFELAARAQIDPDLDVGQAIHITGIDSADLVTAERVAATTRDLCVLVQRVGPVGGLGIDDLANMTERAELRAADVLEHEIRSNSFGRCRQCGTQTKPRFTRCPQCHFRSNGSRPRTRTAGRRRTKSRTRRH